MEKDKSKLVIGSLIIFIGFLISILVACLLPPPVGVGLMGIGILLSVLIGANILSATKDLTSGEVRRAIAISCVCVFFALLAFGDSIRCAEGVLGMVLENFWWIIVTVIGFYFGGRTAEQIVNSLVKRKKNED
jgi:hypothetical protein